VTVGDGIAVLPDVDHLAVVEIDHAVRIGDHRSDVAGKEHLVLPDACDEGASVARPDDPTGLVDVDARDAVGAFEMLNSGENCRKEVSLIVGSNKLRNHLGVRLALEHDPFFRAWSSESCGSR